MSTTSTIDYIIVHNSSIKSACQTTCQYAVQWRNLTERDSQNGIYTNWTCGKNTKLRRVNSALNSELCHHNKDLLNDNLDSSTEDTHQKALWEALTASLTVNGKKFEGWAGLSDLLSPPPVSSFCPRDIIWKPSSPSQPLMKLSPQRWNPQSIPWPGWY